MKVFKLSYLICDLHVGANSQNSFQLFWRKCVLNSVNCALQYSDMLLM